LLVQRQESEQEAIQKISILTVDKQALQEKYGLLQRQMGNLDIEKREAERSKLRLEKDKHVLKKTLDKVGILSFDCERSMNDHCCRSNVNVSLLKTSFVRGIEQKSIDNFVESKKKIILCSGKLISYRPF
jgi:hypothetical protein